MKMKGTPLQTEKRKILGKNFEETQIKSGSVVPLSATGGEQLLKLRVPRQRACTDDARCPAFLYWYLFAWFPVSGVFRYLIWPIRCMYIIYHNIFLVCAQKCLSHVTAWSWNAFHRVETDVIGLPANLLFLCWHSFWDPDSIANSEVHWNTDSCGSLKRWKVWVLIPCSAIAGVRCFGWSSWFLFICLLPSSSFASHSHGAEVFASCCWFSFVCFVFHCKDHTKWGTWAARPMEHERGVLFHFFHLCYCVLYKSQKPNQTFFVMCFMFSICFRFP